MPCCNEFSSTYIAIACCKEPTLGALARSIIVASSSWERTFVFLFSSFSNTLCFMSSFPPSSSSSSLSSKFPSIASAINAYMTVCCFSFIVSITSATVSSPSFLFLFSSIVLSSACSSSSFFSSSEECSIAFSSITSK